MKIKLHIDERDMRVYKISGEFNGKQFKGELKREIGYANGEIEVLDGLDDMAKIVPSVEIEELVPFADEQEIADEEVRLLAKSKGIKNYYNKGIDKLKEQMGI